MHYRLIVSGGLNWEGKQIKRTTTWKPPRPNMSKKQMEREAMAAAFKFEEAIQAGYDIDKGNTCPVQSRRESLAAQSAEA